MAGVAVSTNGKSIRLNDERRSHIIEEHGELGNRQDDVLKTIAEPAQVFAGGEGELLAVREVESSKWLVVVYREGQLDGFVITAFLTRRWRSFEKRRQLWP